MSGHTAEDLTFAGKCSPNPCWKWGSQVVDVDYGKVLGQLMTHLIFIENVWILSYVYAYFFILLSF